MHKKHLFKNMVMRSHTYLFLLMALGKKNRKAVSKELSFVEEPLQKIKTEKENLATPAQLSIRRFSLYGSLSGYTNNESFFSMLRIFHLAPSCLM